MSYACRPRAGPAPFAPAPVDEVVAAIRAEKPAVVFAPHVETASGMILPDDYIRAVSDAVHEVGGLFVLDCIASGCIWVDMVATGVDVLIWIYAQQSASSSASGIGIGLPIAIVATAAITFANAR